MPWQNQNDGDKPDSNNPWGQSGDKKEEGNRNPWGGGNRGGGGGRKGPDLDELFRRGSQPLKGLPNNRNVWALIGGGFVLLWLATTAAYRVDAGEIAVVQRFGQFVRTENPGFKFKLPAPIESVTKVATTQVKSLDVGSSGDDSADENLVLTADQNIVDVAYTVRWNIKNPEDFLFKLEDPEGTVREVAESAMREAMSQTKLDDASGAQRGAVAASVQRRMQDVLDGYRSGVRVTGVFVRQVDPPAKAVSAFRDVTTAQQDAFTYKNQASAYRQQLLANAQGDAARFNAVFEQYKLAPEVTRRRIYLETMEQVMAGTQKVVVDSKGVLPYLPLPPVRETAPPILDPKGGQ
jgi:modulator of FtsH protease HflK